MTKKCILPWVHLYLHQNGDVRPCCHSLEKYSLGNVKEKTLKQIWTSKEIEKIRETFLQNEIPAECYPCLVDEKSGLISQRQLANLKYAQQINKLENGKFEDERFISLDLRLSNICQLSCRICRPESSTGWYKDAVFLEGNKHYSGPITPRLQSESLINEIESNIEFIKVINFAGGEPFQQIEHFEILNVLRKNHLLDVELSYVTNLAHLKYGKYSALEALEIFKNVSLTISLDSVGDRLEYLRKGIIWNEFKENLKEVRSRENLKISFNVTVSIHNVFYLNELFEWLLIEKVEEDQIIISFLHAPFFYNIKSLSDSKKQMLNEKLKELVDYYLKQGLGHLSRQLESILVFANSDDLSRYYPSFISMTKRLDFLRSEKFTELFPLFAEDFL